MTTATAVEKKQALEEASIPTLLMCLTQITGDEKWINAPYLPKRDHALFGDASGGFTDALQADVRQAMSDVLDGVQRGEYNTESVPDPVTALKMMRAYLGENVPPEYALMALEEMGMQDRAIHWSENFDPQRSKNKTILVVGAGISGICTAYRLKELGLNFTVVEKKSALGGTWNDNDYPEAGVDTPNHSYSFSFRPKVDWSAYYSKRREVLDYLNQVSNDLDLTRHVEYDTEVESMAWDSQKKQWCVRLRSGENPVEERWIDVVITAVGQLNRPKMAPFPGMETFSGDWWHSAQWRHDVSLKGKTVAVIGAGASSMQLVRSVAEEAGKLLIFQRSPQWARYDAEYHGKVGAAQHWLLENVPHYCAWYRFSLAWRFGDGLLPTLKKDPNWPHPERAVNARNDKHRVFMTEYILKKLEGRPDLIEKSLPDYPPYGKRILVDNGWYDAIRRDNVDLITEGVERVSGDTIHTTSGNQLKADVIILATGFEAGKMLAPMEIKGRSGTSLREVWGDDNPKAYIGTTVPDYPNLFLLSGPNTALAHGGSMVFMSECQVRYITACLQHMIENNVAALEVKEEVSERYNERVDAEHAELVWTHPGMNNWYRNAQGRVFSPMPWRLVDFWTMTHEPKFSEYIETPQPD